MTPTSQELEPPTVPGRLTSSLSYLEGGNQVVTWSVLLVQLVDLAEPVGV